MSVLLAVFYSRYAGYSGYAGYAACVVLNMPGMLCAVLCRTCVFGKKGVCINKVSLHIVTPSRENPV